MATAKRRDDCSGHVWPGGVAGRNGAGGKELDDATGLSRIEMIPKTAGAVAAPDRAVGAESFEAFFARVPRRWSCVRALPRVAALAGALLFGGVAAPPASAQTPSPSLVFSPSSLTVSESGSGTYTVALGAQPGAEVAVDITGHAGTDVTPDKTSLTFTTANWQSPQGVTVSARADDDATHDEIVLTHTASGGGYDSVSAELGVTVKDTTRMRLEAVVGKVPEGESRAIRAKLPMPLDEDVAITVAVVADSSRADEFELSANRTLTIAAGETGSVGEVTFTSLDDFVYEGVRYFEATLTADHERVDADAERFAVVDDDNTEIIFQVSPSTIFENGGEAMLRAYKYVLHEGVVKIAVTVEPSGRATLSGPTLTFQPGAIYATETLTVTAVDNADDEPDQTITISGMVTEGRGVRTPAPVTLTVVDDENSAAEVALVLTPSRVREGLVSAVTAVASAPLDEEAAIAVSASPGHADTRTDDYVRSANGVLTIPAGGTRSVGTVTVATVDDLLSVGSRRREVTVSGTVTGGGVANPADRTLTILEDDPRVLAALMATPASIPEGGVSTITLRALEPAPADISVSVASYGDSDAAELSADPVLAIARGATESTGTVTLTASQDADTRNENITVVGRPSDDSRFVLVNYPAYVHIVDDDVEDPALTVSPVPSHVFEGGTSAVVAKLSGPLSDDVTVTIGIDASDTNHTASADDFTLSATRTLSIAAGTTDSTGVVTLAAADDAYYGPAPSKRVVWEVVSVTGIARNRLIKHANWTVHDDEAQPRVTLAVALARIGENNGSAEVTARMNTIVAADVEVTVTTVPVGGAEPGDFVQTGSLLTIPANQKTGTGTVRIAAVDDDVPGPDRNLVVTGAVEVVGMEQSGLVWFPLPEGVTIVDDDTRPVFDPDTASRSVAENTAAGTDIGEPVPAATDADGDALTYTLEGTDAASFGFDAGTRQLKTSAALDYEAKDSYSVEVKAADPGGATDTMAVTVNVMDVDEKPATPPAPDVEPVANTADSLFVSWSAPDLNGGPPISGYRLRIKRTGQGSSAWQSRGDGNTTHTYTGRVANTEYEVQVRAQNGETDSDWSPSGTGRTHPGTTETTEVRFGASDYTAVEGGAEARVTVRLSRAHGAAATIPLTTTNQGGASAGDYAGIPASVAFGASQTSASFDVVALSDDEVESGERVRIGFGNLPGDIDAGIPAAATVSLRDADAATPTCNMSIEPNPVTVHEGQTARFAIVISPPLERDDTLIWYVHTYGSATRHKDMGSPGASGYVDLKAGATEVAGEVETYADDEAEPTESFQIVADWRSWRRRPDWRDMPSCVGTVYILDGAAPADAFVSGARLTLRYADALDPGSVPGPRDFVVLSGASEVPVAAVAVAGTDVALVLARAVRADETVTLAYLGAAMHPLRDEAERVELAPLEDLAVRHAAPDGRLAAARATAPGPPVEALISLARAGVSPHLDLSGRGLKDLAPLAGLGRVEELDLSGNRIADLRALAGLARLRALDLADNRVADLGVLAGLTALERLDLSRNRVVDLAPLADLRGLRVLLLDGNRVAEVLPLVHLAGLRSLGLSGNRVADVSLLADLASLERLDLSGNRVADVSPLGDLGTLVWLRVAGNPVADAAPLGRLAHLRWLWADDAASLGWLPQPGRQPGRAVPVVLVPAGAAEAGARQPAGRGRFYPKIHDIYIK